MKFYHACGIIRAFLECLMDMMGVAGLGGGDGTIKFIKRDNKEDARRRVEKL